MIKRIIIAIIAIVLTVVGSAMLVIGQESEIEITTESDAIKVVEVHNIDASESDIIGFWVQSGHSEIVITVNGSITTISPSNNIYYVNTSELNLTSDTTIQLSYLLDLDTTEFEKTLQYNTTSLAITFDGNKIYTGTNLKSGSSLTVALQKPTEGKTLTVEEIPMWVYAIIVLLVILLLLSFMPKSKKQKTTKTKQIAGGSEELLSTKKILLMELLKDVEKKHRAKEISDDTYHKIKDQYKQEAVEAMKALEDMR